MGDEEEKLGATGEFPDGKLSEEDEGELRMQIGLTAEGLVRMDFGKPIAWFSMHPQQACDMAAMIVKHAREAAHLLGKPIVFTI